MEVNPLQKLNAEDPIFVTPVGKVIEVKNFAFVKASFSIEVTVVGIE